MNRNHALTIRTAAPDDLAAVQRIGRETYLDHFATIWSPEALRRFLDDNFSEAVLRRGLATPGERWLLARGPDGTDVGYAKLIWDRPDPVTGVVGAELQKIYLLGPATGKGHGGVLLEAAVAEAAGRDQAAVWLDVLRTNTAARRFYVRHGFETVGEVAFATDRGEIGMVVMMRRLARGRDRAPEAGAPRGATRPPGAGTRRAFR